MDSGSHGIMDSWTYGLMDTSFGDKEWVNGFHLDTLFVRKGEKVSKTIERTLMFNLKEEGLKGSRFQRWMTTPAKECKGCRAAGILPVQGKERFVPNMLPDQ